MSNRTLLEINHDYTGEIVKDPQAFVEALVSYLSNPWSTNPDIKDHLLFHFGVRVFGLRHHQDKYRPEVLDHVKN